MDSQKQHGGSKKRKAAVQDLANASEKAPKKRAAAKPKVKASEQTGAWPVYFQDLFKVFKALNTVLAFCSSRKHMATSFDGIRRSVESTLRRPLDLAQIAELKVLLPDLINFAYIPHNERRVHDGSAGSSSKRAKSPDFSAFAKKAEQFRTQLEPEEHVLTLEFNESSKSKKEIDPSGYALPPTLTPAAMKKLIEKRNEHFCHAVNELILATPHSEDPVLLLQAAAREHIPIDPKSRVPDEVLTQVPETSDRPTVEDAISELRQAAWYKEQILDHRIFEARQPQIGILDPPLSDAIKQALKSARSIDELYIHQAEAINALSSCNHVIVSTSTASGKSVIYQVPLLRFLEEDPNATAIFIYPTKALAQDQKAALEHLLAACPGLEHIQVATYDGDTPQEQRRGVRENASVIFTNFDMLHASVLPHEDMWRRFLKNLKLVAVDELHYYSALFGSHVALIMRRLRRVCIAVGNSRSLFVSCSATIGEPAKHMKNVFGLEDVVQVTEDGAPAGRKDFLTWLPPLINPREPVVGRRSAIQEATELMRFLIKRGIRVILFCKIRKTCEQAMKTLRQDLSAEGRIDILERVMSYRGGYSPEDRRKIEREAFSGNLLGIVATNALELGIDIGTLDAVIMLGFPFSIASFRQQIGRAGRRARDALAVLVGSDYPIDMHYMKFPNELFDKPMNELVIDTDNKIILDAHLQCAAHEMPLCKDDEQYFGPLTVQVCEQSLIKDKEGWYHPDPKFLPYPSKHVSIRGVQDETYCAIDITKLGQLDGQARILEEVETGRALFELYEGAIFIHQGLTFLVREVSHDDRIARLIRTDVNFTTSPRDFTDIDPIKTHRIRELKGSPHRAHYGRVEIKTHVYGYLKIRNKEILDAVDLETAPWERQTTGTWIDVPKKLLDFMLSRDINAAEAIHAAQHAFLNRFPMAADLKTECKAADKEYALKPSKRKRPGRLIFFDPPGQQGGSIAARAFDHVSDTLALAPTCKQGNIVSSKIGALVVLGGILNIIVDEDRLPPIRGAIPPEVIEYGTIVEAPGVGAVEGIEVEQGLEH